MGDGVIDASGFRFESRVAADLWNQIAEPVTSYTSPDVEPGRSYRTWFRGAADPLVRDVELNEDAIGKDAMQAFQSQATKLAYLLGEWDDLRNSRKRDLSAADELAKEIIDLVSKHAEALDQATRVYNNRELSDLKLEYRERMWRTSEAMVLDLEVWTSGSENVRDLWALASLGRGIDPSEAALAEFAEHPERVPARAATLLSQLEARWRQDGDWTVPPSLGDAIKAANRLGERLGESSTEIAQSRDGADGLVREVTAQAEAVLRSLRGADYENRRGDRSMELRALRGEVVATIEEVVRRIRSGQGFSTAPGGSAATSAPDGARPGSDPETPEGDEDASGVGELPAGDGTGPGDLPAREGTGVGDLPGREGTGVGDLPGGEGWDPGGIPGEGGGSFPPERPDGGPDPWREGGGIFEGEGI